MISGFLYTVLLVVGTMVALSSSQRSLAFEIESFDYDVFYSGVDNVMLITLRDFDHVTYGENEGIKVQNQHVNGQVSNACSLEVFYTVNVGKIGCFFPYHAFPSVASTAFSAHVTLECNNGVTFSTPAYTAGSMVSMQYQTYIIRPSAVYLKAGRPFAVQFPFSAVLNATKLKATLNDNVVNISSYQSGTFFLTLETDEFSLEERTALALSIYDENDTVDKRFFPALAFSPSEVYFSDVASILGGFDKLPVIAGKFIYTVVGNGLGHVDSFNVHDATDAIVNTTRVLVATKTEVMINIDTPLFENAYLTATGIPGKAMLDFLIDDNVLRTVVNSVCEEDAPCSLALEPPLIGKNPYTLSAIHTDGSIVPIPFVDISNPATTHSLIYVPSFPKGIHSVLTFSLHGERFLTTNNKVQSVPSKSLFFQQAIPDTVSLTSTSFPVTIQMYGSGLDTLPETQDFTFQPYAGRENLVYTMKKLYTHIKLPAYTLILTEEMCLPVYACFHDMTLVHPASSVEEGEPARISFPFEGASTNLHYRVYFESKLVDISTTAMLQMTKQMQSVSAECTNARFSLIKTVKLNNNTSTWVDLSITNGNQECYQILLENIQNNATSMYKDFALTGEFAGGHTHLQCRKTTPYLLRKDCAVDDEDYYDIPVDPIPSPPHKQPSNSLSTTTIVLIVLGSVLGVAAVTVGIVCFVKQRRNKEQTEPLLN